MDATDRILALLGMSRETAVMGKPGSATERGTAYIKAVNAFCPVSEGEFVQPFVAHDPETADALGEQATLTGAERRLALAIRDYMNEQNELHDAGFTLADLVWRKLPAVTSGLILWNEQDVICARATARFCFEKRQ